MNDNNMEISPHKKGVHVIPSEARFAQRLDIERIFLISMIEDSIARNLDGE